jgi:hypothetical protein
VYRGYHIWRIIHHLKHGNHRMALDAWATPDAEFSFVDAMILVAWIEGTKAELAQRGIT